MKCKFFVEAGDPFQGRMQESICPIIFPVTPTGMDGTVYLCISHPDAKADNVTISNRTVDEEVDFQQSNRSLQMVNLSVNSNKFTESYDTILSRELGVIIDISLCKNREVSLFIIVSSA